MEKKYKETVDKIWELYNKDNNNVLDKKEVSKVLKHLLTKEKKIK